MIWLLLLLIVLGAAAMYVRPHLIPAAPVPNTPPTAHFTFTATLLSVVFADDSSDAEGPIIGWSWNFGDGNTSTAQNPTHVFGAAGPYTVSLTVTDQAGTPSAPFTRTITVAAAGNPPPVAGFTWNSVGLVTSFHDNSTDDGSIVSRDWNFNDGPHATSVNPTHTFSQPGSYNVILTVTDNLGATDTDSHIVVVAAVGTGIPFGVIAGGFATDTTLEQGMDVMNCIEQTPGTPAHLIARLAAAPGLGIQMIVPLTGGDHHRFFFDFGDGASLNPRFDRLIWNGILEAFNTTAVKSAVADAVDQQLLGFDVCDEPNTDGGSDGTGNTWGPTGTLLKVGFNSLSRWHVVVSGNVAIGATTVPINAYSGFSIPSGTRLIFLPGSPIKSCVLTAQVTAGNTTMSVQALPRALRTNDFSNSNAIDNFAAHYKLLFPTAAVGVTHKHFTFDPTHGYAVIDFLLDQYSARFKDAATFGPVTAFRDAGLAMGARDGHQILWSLNVLNGGNQTAGCPLTSTGGPGVSGSNCRMTPAQVLDFGRTLTATNSLGQKGCGLVTWRYDQTFWTLADNRAAFQTLAGELAQKQKVSFHRP